MASQLPPNLQALFAPRPALKWLQSADHPIEQRHTSKVDGVGGFMNALQEYKDNDEYVPTESWLQKHDRIKQEKKEKQQKRLTEDVKQWKPSEDPKVQGDPFKTLFVGRLSYQVRDEDLKRTFSQYGKVQKVRVVENALAKENDSLKRKYRGYAFVEFSNESEMKAALNDMNGQRIRDRRVVVDVERGRTDTKWLPRKYGQGAGGRGYTKAPARTPSAYPPYGGPPGPGVPPRGGFRGGFRGRGDGGFRGRGGGFEGRGGGFGARGGIGYGGGGGFGAPPEGAPAGPRGPRGGGGFDRGGPGYGGPPDRGGRPNGDSRPPWGERSGKGVTGSNLEPVRPRESRGGYEDRDRDRHRDRDRERDGGYGYSRDQSSRKRERDYDDGYDPRKRRY
ncbi:MAG: hypothetical protein M1831_004730 [Alyxoria varia]|nr:MAG: hypothetical protein M1831_004730 [Alyxoria varia]